MGDAWETAICILLAVKDKYNNNRAKKLKFKKYEKIDLKHNYIVPLVMKSEVMPFRLSLVVRKLVFGVFDQVQHKPGCTTTEDG